LLYKLAEGLAWLRKTATGGDGGKEGGGEMAAAA